MPDNGREEVRVSWVSPGIIVQPGAPDQFCLVKNISNVGATVHVRDPVDSDELTLRLSDIRESVRCRVVWRAQRKLGIQFVRPMRFRLLPRSETKGFYSA